MEKHYGTRSTSKKERENQGGGQGTETNTDTSALNTGTQEQPRARQPEQPRVTFADDGTPAQREYEASESRTPGAEHNSQVILFPPHLREEEGERK